MAVRPQPAAALGRRLGLTLADGRVLGSRTQALRGSGIASADLARRLAAESDVEWAVVDGRKTIRAVTPNDPLYADNQTTALPVVGQWYLRAPDSTLVAAIDAVGAWAFTTGSSTVTVAVLDTGVRFDHPDLANKLYPGYDFISDTATANDGSGRDSDASDPGDWTTSSDGCTAGNSSWHGTQTAGIIGASTDNGIGIASVGRDVMVLPVRVLGKCGGFDSDIIAAMRWSAGLSADPVANSHPARVINMSLGSSGSCSSAYVDVFAEMVAHDVAVVVAAGNDNGLAVGTPANCAGAIAVGGLRHQGTKVGYSDIGPEIALSAPAGNCVNSDTPANSGRYPPSQPCLYPLVTTTNSGSTTPVAGSSAYTGGSNTSGIDLTLGTSFSSPQVAGVIGLMLSANSALTLEQIRSVLQSSARSFPSSGAGASVPQCHAPDSTEQIECYCTSNTCGAGMLDARASVVAVAAGAVLPPAFKMSVGNTAPTAGTSVNLSVVGAAASGGRSVSSYQWSIFSGAGLANFDGATNGPNATLLPQSAGTVTVELRVTDSAGASSTSRRTMTIQAAPTPTDNGGSGSGSGGGSSGSSSGGGGGAVSPFWLGALGVAALLRRRRR